MSDTPPPPATTRPAAGEPRRSRRPGTFQLAIVVAILAVGLLLTALTADVTRMSEPGIRLVNEKPFLPGTAGQWTGSEQTGLTEDERAVLPSDTEGARRIYTDKDGHTVYCSVVLAGRDVTSIHRPEVCLDGQGWQQTSTWIEKIETPVAPNGVLPVTRLNSSKKIPLKNGQSVVVYSVFVYWFIGKDRTTPYHWQRIYWTTLDRVLHNRNHRWAYFLINSVVPPESAGKEPIARQNETMKVITRFIQEIYPHLASERPAAAG